jgi:hypothetical protein
LRRHQQDLVPQPAQQPRPVMRGAARFDADARRRQLGKDFLDRAAPDLPPQHRLFVLVNPTLIIVIRTAPLAALLQPHSLAQFDAVGGRPPQQGLQGRMCVAAFAPMICVRPVSSCSCQWQALDPRFRGGDDILLRLAATFRVRLLDSTDNPRSRRPSQRHCVPSPPASRRCRPAPRQGRRISL